LLRYFRINDPYRLIGLLVLFTIVCLPFFIDPPETNKVELHGFLLGEKVSDGFRLYTEIIDDTPPLAAWFYGVTSALFNRSLLGHHFLAFLVLFFQAAFLGIIFIDKKAFTENTYIPSFIFFILTLISFDFFSLTADLVAFGFSLLALNNLFKEIEFRIQRDETMFNLGLWISMATLLNFSFIVYLPGVILILIIFTRNTPRKYLLLSFGFLFPNLILITYYFLHDSTAALYTYYYLANFKLSNMAFTSMKSLLILAAVPAFYFIVSLFILNRDARFTKYQSQLSQAMFLWFLVSLTQLFLTTDLRPQSLLVLLPSASFFFTHFFLLIRRRKFIEINAWILMILMVSLFYLNRYNQIKAVDYSTLLVQPAEEKFTNKKILNLGESSSIFLYNSIAPPFIDHGLTQEVFHHPDYYENVFLVDALFKMDPPEIIIDPQDLMTAYLTRIPALQKRYEKIDVGYELKNSD
jgi:hypothetical protein